MESRGTLSLAGTPQPLFSCRAREDRGHQLRWGLTGGCRLGSERAVDAGRKWNVGDDERARRHHIGGELLLEDRIVPHAAPPLGNRQISHVRDRRTVGREQHIRQLGVRDVGLLDLELVDEIVYLVGNIDAVPGSHELDLRVIDKIGNYTRADWQSRPAVWPRAGRQPRTPLKRNMNAIRFHRGDDVEMVSGSRTAGAAPTAVRNILHLQP
jgi:hypothetical protein